MKGFRRYIYLVFCITSALFAGCELLDEAQGNNPMEVKLFARMGVHLDVKSSTKGAITSTTNQELQIGVVRLDQKTGESNTPDYPYFKYCQSTPFQATLSKPDADEGNLRTVTSFSESQFFKNSTDEITYAAWYPWPDDESSSSDGYVYSTSADSTVITFPITGDSDIMYSSVVSGKKSNGFDLMQFKHALSMFRIHVYRSTTNFDWGSLKSISINGLPDICKITLPKSSNMRGHAIWYNTTPSDDQSAHSGLNLSISYTNGENIPVGFENKQFIREWIAAPAAVTENGLKHLKKLDISLQTSEQPNIPDLPIVRDFKPGYIYDIVLRFSDDGIIDAQIEMEDWIDSEVDINSEVGSGGIFYNLSAYGTANCYIVSAANFGYSFDATVKGNGNTDALTGSNINTALDPKYVDIIWAEGVTYSNGVTSTAASESKPVFELETRKIVEGKVLFKINGNQSNHSDKSLPAEGNVLLGVYDKDIDQQDRKCLWTWHIWITDKPQDQNYTRGYVVLDRNLGATASAPEGTPTSSEGMKGLFYQWGRPTPFHLVNGNVDAKNSYRRVTPDVAVAHPKVFYGRYEKVDDEQETSETKPKDANDYHDWVDRTKFADVNSLWGYRRVEHEKPIKTIYDPCPHGYHVPYARNWENMERYWDNKPSSENKGTDAYKNAWEALPGIKFNIQSEGTVIWYPFQGYINKDGVYKTGHFHMNGASSADSPTPIVEVWSSLINRHVENNTNDDSPYRFLFNLDNEAVLSDSYSNRSRGLAVRCVSDNTVDVVKDLSAYQTSNCYMVHEDGYYKFKATVRGNGVGSLLPLGGSVTAEINAGLSTTIKPVKVDILWWQGDFTKPEDFTSTGDYAKPANMCLYLLDGGILCDDGYVSFQISKFSKGNVVLAAYDDAGTILWTWHIWLTDKPEDKLSGNYTKMDRFLGATHAPVIPVGGSGQYIIWGKSDNRDDDVNYVNATLGFYYQWGRKDPIIGPLGFSSSGADEKDEAATHVGEEVASSGWWKKDGDKWVYSTIIPTEYATTIPDVVRNPTAFYKSTTASGAENSQWFNSSFADGYTNVALWGYAVADYSIQGQTFSKTMYDPCPPGYRTPFHHSWYYSNDERYASDEWNGSVSPYTWPNDGTGWETNFAWDYGIVTNKTHFERMWYPYAGYRDPLTGGYDLVGVEGHMNTGMPMRKFETRTFWYTNSNSGQDAGGKSSAYGMSVRCMKE